MPELKPTRVRGSSQPSARYLAVWSLDRIVRAGERPIPLPPGVTLPARERRRVMELVLGVLRHLSLLDHDLEQLSRRSPSRLDPAVAWILRLALYEMRFLRVPDHAAVHQAVELCRRWRKSSAASFVNAVLRSFQRQAPEVPSDDSVESLSVRFSHPPWLVRRWVERWGVEAARGLLERNAAPPPRVLWVNPFRLSRQELARRLQAEGISSRTCAALPQALEVEASDFASHPLYREGYCFFMGPASQEVAFLGRLEGRRRLADFCAAPGGKAFVLSTRKDEGSSLYCCDRSWRRLHEMVSRARLCRIRGLHFVQADLAGFSPLGSTFDFILLDVPCSGLGTLRANPDIRWKVREEDLERLQQRQWKLLETGFQALRPGGELVYCTCSTEPEENETVVHRLLAREREALELAPPWRSFPQPHPGECLFAARIGRRP